MRLLDATSAGRPFTTGPERPSTPSRPAAGSTPARACSRPRRARARAFRALTVLEPLSYASSVLDECATGRLTPRATASGLNSTRCVAVETPARGRPIGGGSCQRTPRSCAGWVRATEGLRTPPCAISAYHATTRTGGGDRDSDCGRSPDRQRRTGTAARRVPHLQYGLGLSRSGGLRVASRSGSVPCHRVAFDIRVRHLQ